MKKPRSIMVSTETKEHIHDMAHALWRHGVKSTTQLVEALLSHKHDYDAIMARYEPAKDYLGQLRIDKKVLESLNTGGIQIRHFCDAILSHCASDLDLVTKIWLESKGDK